MSEFNISSYIKVLKEGLQETQENTTRLLFDAIILSMSNPVDLKPKFITSLMQRKVEVQNEIKKASADPMIIAEAKEHFNEEILSKINSNLLDDTCSKICDLYMNDKTVPLSKRDSLDTLFTAGKFGDFLCESFLYAINRENRTSDLSMETDDVPLLSEVNYQCPICHTKLIKKIKNKPQKKYEITPIFPLDIDDSKEVAFTNQRTPSKSLTSNENMIALCPDCSEAYLIDQDINEYTKLFDIKSEATRNYQLQVQLTSLNLEEEIQKIVIGLSKIDSNVQIQDFRMDPLLISKKIEPSNFLLTNSITNYVLQYYKFIQKLFSDLDSFADNRFNIIASEIKLAYETIETTSNSQEETYSLLSDWIMSNLRLKNSYKYKLACDIVIAFFVQNCEVFHEIT